MRRRNPFLSACGSIVLLCLCFSGIASCNGNGGSHDGGGPVYTPGATSSGSGTTENSGSTISADELLALSNGGNTGAILSRFSGPNASTATTTVSFSSSVLGLPADGYVTLVMTGQGIAYTADATDPGSGTVSFTIPQIAVGTEITVSIIVKRADGTVVCAGSKTQTVTGNSSDIQVPLTGEGSWPLPSAIAVNASPSTITYDAGLYAATPPGSQTVTFSVAGLSAPPSGSISYEWSLPTGAPLGSGDSITLDLKNDLLGTPPAGGLYNCGIIVTATCTDEEGAVTTASGTGVVAVTVLEIPAFTIEVTLPAGVTAHKNAAGTVVADSYDIVDFTKTFTFTATATAGTGYPAGAFPAGTEFEWGKSYDGTIGSETTTAEHKPASFDVAPSLDLGPMYAAWYTSDTPPKTFYVSCSATNGKAINSPKNADSSKTVKLYKPKLPKPEIDYSCIADARDSTEATETTPASCTYYQRNEATDPTFTLGVRNGSDMPAGTKWKLNIGNGSFIGTVSGFDSSANTDIGTQLSGIILAQLADSASPLPATTRAITVVVEHPSYESNESDALKFKVYPPPPASIVAFETSCDCSGTCLDGSMTYQVTASSAFTAIISPYFSVLPADNSGAVFKWYAVVGGTRTLVGTRDSSGNLPLSMSNLGIDVSSLPSDSASGSDGPPLTVYFEYEVSFPGTTLTRTGSPSSTGYLYLYQ